MGFTKQTVRDIDVNHKKVLMCVDYNVPINDDGTIADDSRVRASLPTIQFLMERGCSLILISHLGRPKSREDKNTSLMPVRDRLSELLQMDVWFADDCVGEKVKTLSEHLEPGQVMLLENVRYHKEEEENDEGFARQIVESTGAEVYVQECFGTAHRAHASTFGVPKLLPSVAGFLIEHEVSTITSLIENPERPLMVIVGGAKIADKLDVLHKFIEVADFVAVGGAMANTFLKASGAPVGASLVDDDEGVEIAKDLIAKAKDRAMTSQFTLFIPKDVVVAADVSPQGPTRVVDLSHHNWADINSYPKKPETPAFEVGSNEKILDIGPFSAAYIAGAAKLARTAIWNGTVGVTEVKGLAGAADPFAHGTRIVVDGLVGESAGEQNHPYAMAGGGDTVSFIESVPGLRERFAHVSTGGGASLDLLAGKELPGVSVLMDKEQVNG